MFPVCVVYKFFGVTNSQKGDAFFLREICAPQHRTSASWNPGSRGFNGRVRQMGFLGGDEGQVMIQSKSRYSQLQTEAENTWFQGGCFQE